MKAMHTSTLARRIATLIATATLLAACGADKKDDDDKPKAQAGAASAVKAESAGDSQSVALTAEEMSQSGIRVEAIQPTTVNAPVTLTGSVSANQDRIAKVVPRLPGRITAVPAMLGADVKAGQALAVVESIELGEARSALLQAKSEASVSDAALTRAEKLSAEDIVPRKDYLRAKADADRAQAALRAAIDKLRMLGVSPTVADGRADAVYPLTSPLAGTIIEKQAVVGTLADKDPLFTVADLSNIWVVADVFERDLPRLAKGAMADVTVAAYPTERFSGRLVYLSDTLDQGTRTVKAHIEVPNPHRRLKPGMFASATVATTVAQQALVLPAGAVTLMDGKPTVFVAKGNTFMPRTIEKGSEIDGKVTVKEGLNAGERIAVQGAYALKSRMLKSQLGTND